MVQTLHFLSFHCVFSASAFEFWLEHYGVLLSTVYCSKQTAFDPGLTTTAPLFRRLIKHMTKKEREETEEDGGERLIMWRGGGQVE